MTNILATIIVSVVTNWTPVESGWVGTMSCAVYHPPGEQCSWETNPQVKKQHGTIVERTTVSFDINGRTFTATEDRVVKYLAREGKERTGVVWGKVEETPAQEGRSRVITPNGNSFILNN